MSIDAEIFGYELKAITLFESRDTLRSPSVDDVSRIQVLILQEEVENPAEIEEHVFTLTLLPKLTVYFEREPNIR